MSRHLSTAEVAELVGMNRHHLASYMSAGHACRWIDAFPHFPRNPGSGQRREWAPIDVPVVAMLRDLTLELALTPRTVLAADMRLDPRADVLTVRVADRAVVSYRPRWDLLDAAEARLMAGAA